MTVQAISQAGIPSAPLAGHSAPVRPDPASSKAFIPAAESGTKASDALSPSTGPTEIRDAVEKIKQFVLPVTSDIQFSIDEDTDKTVVTVVDRGTKEVIRQIPSEEMLEIAKALDRLQGLLIRQKA
jgi:flagellar protein FlaG